MCISISVYKYFLNDDSKTDNKIGFLLLSKALDLMSLFESMNYSPRKLPTRERAEISTQN